MQPSADAELRKLIEETALVVHSAEDRKDDREIVARAHIAVEQLGERYRDASLGLTEGQKLALERSLGRRVQDLKRLASMLPRIGSIAHATPDRQVTGPSLIGERMITGVSWQSAGKAAPAASAQRVGTDVEAWCGTCKDLTNHSIFALVGNKPKIVTCSVCNSRHNFRTEAARSAAAAQPDPAAGYDRQRNTERAAEDRQRQKQTQHDVIASEIMSAEQVIPFDPKRRFRVGEVLDHPGFGRGKVETVLRSSMLVRFAQGGLKSVMLF